MMEFDHSQPYDKCPKLFRVLFSILFLFLAAARAHPQQFIINPGASQSSQKKPMEATPNQQQTNPAQPQAPLLTREEAVRLALGQASAFQQAQINERLANEDVKQSQKAFLPRLQSTGSFIYTTPAPGARSPATPSFIAANAITEYEALVGVTGDIDVNGRLRAALKRSLALLDAARAGTLVARRALELSTNEAYYGLAAAIARRRAAEQNLAIAREFERNTELSLQAGEVAEIDLVRARLQTNRRLDELEVARTDEAVAREGLRVLIGVDGAAPLETTDLAGYTVTQNEIDRFTAEALNRRPELAQLEAQQKASEHEITAARAERLPQITYSINGGFDTDSLKTMPLHNHSGSSATISLTIPLFDWGISKSREQQARLRAEALKIDQTLALRNFAQQFYVARAQAGRALNRVQIAKQGLQDAERNVTASIARYRAGEAQIVEVTDSQNTLVTQRTALYQAIFDYQIALARLAAATGQ